MSCCDFNTPPWFYKELPQPTTDDIEMRVCADEERSAEDIAIEIINIYIQFPPCYKVGFTIFIILIKGWPDHSLDRFQELVRRVCSVTSGPLIHLYCNVMHACSFPELLPCFMEGRKNAKGVHGIGIRCKNHTHNSYP
jgi:hypothetical protein